ncbi:MAG: hypothetical protein BroJett021_00840 [Chloroflexota bacterium]|nr:MAG: hypothetical protein BroJett021_00840 [Chloroflexota bacterium]
MKQRFALFTSALLAAGLLILLTGAVALAAVNANPPAIDDFESGLPGSWFQYGDYGSGAFINTTIVPTDAVPGLNPNNVLQIQYNSAGWGAGTGNNLGGQDWSSYDGLAFWFKGANTGGVFRVILSDNPNPVVPGDSAERFAYEFVDNSTGWRYISIPWTLFFRDYAFQPGGAPDDGLTLTEVQAYAIALPSGTNATVHLDEVGVFGGLTEPQITFVARNVTVDEGNPVTLTVALNMASAFPVSVDYATVDGAAVAGSDYVAASGTAVIPAGSMSANIVVTTLDDSEVEGNQTFMVVLSNPVSATLTSQVTATVTIRDNDQAPVEAVGSPRQIVDDYEYTNGLPAGADANNNGIGFVTWNAQGASAGVGLTVPTQQVPGKPANNQVLQLDLNLGAGQWGGFSHAFENEAVDTWVSQDWSRFVGVSFWLYGNNTGSVIFVDLQENRNPGSTRDDAERWSVDIPDDFTGWRYFEIPFTQFNRKDIGNGAPNDGFDGKEIWGYAFGGFNTINNQSYFIDDFALLHRATVVDDYEYTNGLPAGADANNNGIGFVTWNAPGASAGVGLAVPAQQVPSKPANNQVLQLDLNLGAGQWGGFSHAFENEAVDAWISQDWSTYEGVAFWLYGNNTGSVIFVDLQENRNPGSTRDDAERWSVDIPDDFTGWRYFQIPFTQFNRKDIGNGAPNDGFDGKEIWGYAFGGFNTINNQSYFIDDFTIYGNKGGLPEELRVAFAAARFSVIEGATAVMTVSLNMTSTTPVTVTYATAEGQATTGVDYTPVSGALVFAPGEQHKTIQVPTIDDDKHEPTERLMVNLTGVEGAVFAFQRRAMLEILDNDPANPDKLDDFEGFHPFQKVGDVMLSITELAAGNPNALPGQGAREQVLTVQYNNAAATANRIFNFFTQPQNWSAADGLTFWYFGGNTGRNITVELWDNQLTNTNNMTSTEWVLRWSDEFNEPAGTPPNPNNWRHEIGDGTLNDIPGWGNSEFQFYTDDPANASTDGNGNLVLRMSKVNTETTSLLCYYGPCRYTSARLISADRAEFQYGKIEARMKLPPTNQSGIWPAFWALGANINDPGVGWPQSGEIDIMEYVSRVPNEIFGTIHGPGYSGGASFGNTINIPNLLDDYHVYTVEWRENHIIWYVDGVKYHEARNTSPFLSGKQWVFNHPFFLLLNVAIGGNFGGAISDQMTFPQDTLVDWVRVYQAPNQAELFEASFVDNFTGWRKIVLPFTAFTRSAQQPAGAPNDGLTLTSVNGYGFRFPSGGQSVVAQAQVTAHIDQVSLLNFVERWWYPLIFSGASSSQ